MIYLFKCRVCGFSFAYEEGGEILCPRCRAKYIRKESKKNVKKILKKKFVGNFVAVGTKRCGTCLHSQTLETTSAVRCALPKPEVIFHGEKKIWICYSFQKKK